MKLFLIRHAQSANNAKPEHQRVEDPGLTDIGREQAQRLGTRIPSLDLTHLVTSPFRRALATTDAAIAQSSLVPEVWTDLHEQGGCYRGHEPGQLIGRPGMTRSAVEQEFAGYRVEDAIDDQGWWKSQPYETWEEARRRAQRLVDRTVSTFAPDDRVAFVMHADFKQLFIQTMTNRFDGFPYNTSISTLTISRDQQALDEYNCVAHLTDDLVSW